MNLVAFNEAYECGFEDSELQEIISTAFWDAENIVNLAMGTSTNKEALESKYFNKHPLIQEMRTIWKDKVHDGLLQYTYGPIVGKNGEEAKFVPPAEEKITHINGILDQNISE